MARRGLPVAAFLTGVIASADTLFTLGSGAVAIWVMPTTQSQQWVRFLVDRLIWWHISLLGVAIPVGFLAGLLEGRRDGRPRRYGTAGLWLSMSSFCLMVMGLPALVLALRHHADSRRHICLSHIKQLAVSLQLYCEDADGKLPQAVNWCDAVGPYSPSTDALRCPEAETLRSAYALNSGLAGRSPEVAMGQDDTVLVFETERGWNVAGNNELLPDMPRHLGGDTYSLADGHAKYALRRQATVGKHGSTIWAKEPVSGSIIWKPVLKKGEEGRQ